MFDANPVIRISNVCASELEGVHGFYIHEHGLGKIYEVTSTSEIGEEGLIVVVIIFNEGAGDAK